MGRYRAPLDDIEHCLFDIAGLTEGTGSSVPDRATTRAILKAAARMAEEVIAPLDRDSDRIGARFEDGRVVLPPGFGPAYAEWRQAGWIGADASVEAGGMGLPIAIGGALTELWHSGSMAFAMGLLLTQAAAQLLEEHGSPGLRDYYVPRLLSGEHSGAMSLTEPQAGTDLGAVRTEARPASDGSFRLFGDKIFISYGRHDMAENMIHMVLARTPGAPPGAHGLSVFLVPWFLPASGSAAREPNDIACVGIERKMGMHGSPTCQIRYGPAGEGARGWLIGAEGQGLAAMFTMMNRARLGTGLQGTAIAERATQAASAYAGERVQGGRAIVGHPDVERMLLQMRADAMACRAISYLAAVELDRAARGPDPERRGAAAGRAALLTPIVKAFASELGCEVASRAIQIHGGLGYVEESGVAQLYRDGRIMPIYEGTSAVQAIDLVQRKIARAGPQAAARLIEELSAIVVGAEAAPEQEARWCANECRMALRALAAVLGWLVAQERDDADRLWAASSVMTLFGSVLGGTLLLKGAIAAATGSERRATMVRLASAFALARVTHAGALAREATQSGQLLAARC